MTNRFNNVVVYNRWEDDLDFTLLFSLVKLHKNTHIIIDSAKENSICAPSGTETEEFLQSINECREWNSVHGNKLTLILGNYKQWHLEHYTSNVPWKVFDDENYQKQQHLDLWLDWTGRSVIYGLWDDVQIWPTYFLVWNGFKIFKHCVYSSDRLGSKNPYPNINKLFCLKVKAAKPHRVLLLDELSKRNLLTPSNLFTCHGPENVLNNSLETINGHAYNHGIVTIGQDFDNNDIYSFQPPGADDTLIEVVSETDSSCYFYTEKTVWPIVYRKPFVIQGAQYQNHDLQKLGFVLYDEYIDYSFDKLRDSRDRTVALADELLRLTQQTEDYAEVYRMLLPKIQHNLKRLLELYHYDEHVPAVIKQYGSQIYQQQMIERNISADTIADPIQGITWLPYVENNFRNQCAVDHIRSQPYLSDLFYRDK